MGLLAVVVVVALAAGLWFWTVPRWEAEAKHWMVQGPPCRQLTAGQFQAASADGPMQVDNFDDIDFGRAYGHVSCADIHDDGGHGWGQHAVCQFSSPTRVVVRTARSQAYFEAVPGQPVTVSVLKDRAECVVGGNEWGAHKG
jgi:hypothetical protein